MKSDEAVARRALESAGVTEGGLVSRRGWSNAAWIGDRYVIRASPGRLRGSLEHEHRVVGAVGPRGIPVAPAIASGRHAEGEWIVSHRLRGRTLAEAWPDADATERRHIGLELGTTLRALHCLDLPDLPPPPWWVDAHDPANFHNAYKPHVDLAPQMVDAARRFPGVDHRLLDRVDAMVRELRPLFDGDRRVLTHADVHGHNVFLAGPSHAVHLLDWEGAHHAAADLELDMLLRWSAAAHAIPEEPDGEATIAEGDATELVDHVAAGYPELFGDTPRLRRRLEYYAVQWHLVQVHFDRYWRDTHPELEDEPPVGDWSDLRVLVDDGRSHLDTFRALIG